VCAKQREAKALAPTPPFECQFEQVRTSSCRIVGTPFESVSEIKWSSHAPQEMTAIALSIEFGRHVTVLKTRSTNLVDH
jgi:hypothetical protein